MSEEGDIPDQESKIGTFYAGKSVFITGATGFMGKVRRLKLFLRLRACSTLEKLEKTRVN